LDGNTLFFLDAHFPGADAGLKDYDSEKDYNVNLPLAEELKLISTGRKDYADVIIVDDMRLFEENSKIRFGDVDGHFKKIGKKVSRNELVKFDINEIFREYYSDRTIERNYNDEGYYIISR
jgi:hypothetical protein